MYDFTEYRDFGITVLRDTGITELRNIVLSNHSEHFRTNLNHVISLEP